MAELCTPVLCKLSCNSFVYGPFVKNLLVDGKILHSGEGGNVERWLEPRNKSFMFEFAFVLLSIAYYFSYLCGYSFCLISLLAYHISLSLSVNAHLNKKAIEHLNSLSRGIKEEKF